MLKLIFAPDDRKLLGVSLIGESATELIHIGMMVLDNGLTIDEFIEQVFNYPTLSETYKYAAYDGLGNLSGHKLREGQSPVAAADLGVAHHPVLASKPMRRILHATRTN